MSADGNVAARRPVARSTRLTLPGSAIPRASMRTASARGVAALFRRALAGLRLRSAEYGDVGDARVGGDDGGDRLDAERDLADERARSRRRARRASRWREAATTASRLPSAPASARDGGRAGHVVAERAGVDASQRPSRPMRCRRRSEAARPPESRRASGAGGSERPTDDDETRDA